MEKHVALGSDNRPATSEQLGRLPKCLSGQNIFVEEMGSLDLLRNLGWEIQFR